MTSILQLRGDLGIFILGFGVWLVCIFLYTRVNNVLLNMLHDQNIFTFLWRILLIKLILKTNGYKRLKWYKGLPLE